MVQLLSAVLLGAMAGLAAGKYLRAHRQAEVTLPGGSPAQGVIEAEVPARNKANKAGSHVRSGPVAAKLEADLAMSSDVTRWLYWFEALENAGPADLPRLVQLAGKNLNLIRLLASRFAERYPLETFDSVIAGCRSGDEAMAGEFAWRFFREWTRRDPRAAIAALEKTKDVGQLDYWRSSVAGDIFDIDPELGLKQMWEWHIGHYVPNLAQVEKWAAADPQHAAEVTLQYPAGSAAQSVMETIAKEWAKRDPAAALKFSSTARGELGSKLASTVLLDWAGRDVTGSADWLAHSDRATLDRLAPQFVEGWAKSDAEAALSWAELNLNGSSLAQATGAAARGEAEKDITNAAEMVLSLEPSPGRVEAALAVAEKWMPRSWGDNPQMTTPAALTNWIGRLDPDSLERTLKDNRFHDWVETDPKGVASFLEDPALKGVPWAAYFLTAQVLARRDPSEAIAWAERVPVDQRIGVGAAAFSQWHQAQPEPAMAWLNSLPEEDSRRLPFFENAIRWMAWDAQGEEKINQLSASGRAIAVRVIQNMEFRDEEQRSQLLARIARH